MKIIEIVTSTCSVCKMLKSMIEKTVELFNINLEVYIADTEEGSAMANKFLEKYNIKSVPAFFFMKDDEVIDTHFGAITMPVLKNKIETLKNYGK